MSKKLSIIPKMCETCGSWMRMDKDKGLCFRNPPQTHVVLKKTQQVVTVFPRTNAASPGCGKWHKREGMVQPKEDKKEKSLIVVPTPSLGQKVN